MLAVLPLMSIDIPGLGTATNLEAVGTTQNMKGEMRSAFVELWKNPDFIRDDANVVKTKPILLTAEEAQNLVAALAKVKPEIKAFLLDYSNRLVR